MSANHQSKIETINALAELERAGVRYDPASEHEVRIVCPFHDDKEPSLSLNTEKNVWFCQASSCKKKGDIISLLARVLGVERGIMIVDLSSRYDLEEVKTINPTTVEKFHEDVWTAGPLLQALRDRGITDVMIRQARLGFYAGRITIPVYDLHGNVVNVRRYLPGAPGPQKMQNSKGYGSPPHLYQVDQTRFEKVWICGGEMKALVVGSFLNPHGIGAVAVTAGEGAWEAKFNPLLKGKHVFLNMDIDAAGKAATRKLGQILVRIAASVSLIELPLDPDKFPKGDVNDYVGRCGATSDDLLRLTGEARPYSGPTVTTSQASSGDVKRTSLARSTDPSNIAKRIGFAAVPVAMDTIPYLVPARVSVTCDRAQPNCHLCPISGMEPNPEDGNVRTVIPATSSGLLDLVGSPASQQEAGIRSSLGIPKCKSVAFVVTEHYEVRDVRLAPQLSIASEGSNNVVQPAYVVGASCDLNTPYEMAGVVYPHPKNQQAVLVVDQADQADDNLNTFAPTPAELKSLAAFQPEAWTTESLRTKLASIYQDLSTNVTRIYGRMDVHLLIDLTYHSPLVFTFDGKLTSGWVNTLLLGDSSQGKSEACLRLMEHYGLGERVELKSATAAGLIGGLQQLGNRWFVSWGVIPTHDRRLVILEEVKGAPIEVIGKMTDMRSSGIAEIPKIERRRANARTRLIFVSNPRSNRTMASYNFGVEAIKELIGSLEDVRRFDAAVIVSASQVSPDVVNSLAANRPVVEKRFTAELCRRAVLYGWTRKVDQVKFDPDAVTAILTSVVELCSKFSETLPLIDRGTMRFKIARLAASLAVRTFSTMDEDIETVRVRKCHIEFIAGFLEKQYSSPVFGYLDFSKAQIQANMVMDPGIVENTITSTKYPSDLVRQLLVRDEVSVQDFMDWCELEIDDARSILSFFVRKHCLFRGKVAYSKTAEFIVLLKAMEAKGVAQSAQVKKGEEF